MKRSKKLLASTLIALSILATSSVGSFAAPNTTPNIAQQQQFFTLARLPQGALYGDLTIGQNVISWQGSYDQYQVSVREWASLASFQANPESGGSSASYLTRNTSYNYEFKSGRVYRVWVYGKDAGKLFSIGAYEWQQP